MQALIENLVKLQAIELERARITQETRALPAELAEAGAALTAAQQKAAEASGALSREESLRTRLEREIAEHRSAPSLTP
jgi:predicted  nucleic acid-binding Zn-ribbon protein